MSISCDSCGTVATGGEAPLEWVTSVERGQTQHYCDRCARDNLRAIEARLDPAWW